MRNKLILGLIICCVSVLAADYFLQLHQEKGRQLVTDAYYADLLAVKEDVQLGAPLDYTFYFQDEQRQYNGVWFNALHAAASGGNEDIINFLLDQGLSIDTPTPDGWTPLFIASRDGQAEAAKLLIYRGADLNKQTNRGATPLLMILTQPFPYEKQRLELLEYILRRGANPNLKDRWGFTPLYYAVHSQNPQAVSLLLEYKANPAEPAVLNQLKQLAKQSTPQAKKITALLTKRLEKLAFPVAREQETP